MRRVDGERREDGEDVGVEMVLQPGHVIAAEVVGIDEQDAGHGEVAPQLAPPPLLLGGEVGHALADLDQLLRRRQAVLGRFRHALADFLAQTSDAHHEELIEVGRGNRQEAQLLEERMVAVRGLLEDPAVELQPGQLTVDEAQGRGGEFVRSLAKVTERVHQRDPRRRRSRAVTARRCPGNGDVRSTILRGRSMFRATMVVHALNPRGFLVGRRIRHTHRHRVRPALCRGVDGGSGAPAQQRDSLFRGMGPAVPSSCGVASQNASSPLPDKRQPHNNV